MNLSAAQPRPIFVTGADRSGTTLLYQLLGSHPNISMVRRTNLFRWFHGRYGNLGSKENLQRALDELLGYPRLDTLRPSRREILAEFELREPTYGNLFDILHAQHARRRGKPRWGDKSLHHEHCAETILTEFPEASIIHILRDPRDRFASASRRYADRPKSAAAIAGRWVESAAAARANTISFGARYLVLRFEDLVLDTEPTLRQVCEMIDEPFDQAMFAMEPDAHESANSDPNSSFDDIAPRTISASPVGRHREVLTDQELEFVELVSRDHMMHFGYEPSSNANRPVLTRHPRIQIDVARTRLWRARSAGADGKTAPPAHRLRARRAEAPQ